MEERIPSKSVLITLIDEIHQTLENSNDFYLRLIQQLKSLDLFLNFLAGPSLHTEEGKRTLKVFKEILENYLSEVERLVFAYQDLSIDLQSLSTDRSLQDPLIQELAREGDLLNQTIQVRQEIAKVFLELSEVFDQIVIQQKVNPTQAKKVEDLVFRLQLLG